MQTKKLRSNATYNATWAGRYWGTRGAIRLALRDFVHMQSNLSALSSTFYSAVSVSNGIRRYIAAGGALASSELFAGSRGWRLACMTPDERDIRGTILAMVGQYCPVGFVARWYLTRARRYVHSIVFPNSTTEVVSAGTRYLALGLLARIHVWTGLHGDAHRVSNVVLRDAPNAKLQPEVATRVYRSIGEVNCLLGDVDTARMCLLRSLAFARNTGLVDAVHKTEAVAVQYHISLTE